MVAENMLVNLSGTQVGITGSHCVSYTVLCGLVSGTGRYTPVMVDETGLIMTSGTN